MQSSILAAMSYLNELNEVQREAVVNTDGPTLNYAGPGSGQNAGVAYRIAHLINSGVDAFSIGLDFYEQGIGSDARADREDSRHQCAQFIHGHVSLDLCSLVRTDAQRIGYPSNFTIYDTEIRVRSLKPSSANKD